MENENYLESCRSIPVAPAASTEAKSNNRRTVVNELRERLMKVDMASVQVNKAKTNNLTAEQSQQQSSSSSLPHVQQMRDLRQRLMNLERPKKLPQQKPVISSRQSKRELHQRLLQLDQRGKQTERRRRVSSEDEANANAGAQRRQQQLSQQDNNNNYTNSLPKTPTELNVKRMHEFRQRLLKLDKSLPAFKSKRKENGSKISRIIKANEIQK